MSKDNRYPDNISSNEKAAILSNKQQVINNTLNGLDENKSSFKNLQYPSLNFIENNNLNTCTIPNCIGVDNNCQNPGCFTGATGSSDSTASQLNQLLQKVTALSTSLNSVQTNLGSLFVGGEDEQIFYDRKLRPLIDMLYFLTQSAQGAAITAQNMQSNAYAKKKQIKLPIDLSYEIIKESYCVFETLKRRNAIYRHIIENDIKSSGCINENFYKSSFCGLDDDYFEELNHCYNKMYND